MVLMELYENNVLVAAVVALLASQLIKYIIILIKFKKIDFKEHFWYFTFPSSHASFIGAAVVAAGLAEGFGSALFAVGLVLMLSYLFDLVLFRRLFGSTNLFGKHKVGHDLRDVIAGLALGIFVAILFFV